MTETLRVTPDTIWAAADSLLSVSVPTADSVHVSLLLRHQSPGEPSQWLFLTVSVLLGLIGLLNWLAARKSAESARSSVRAAELSATTARESLEWIRSNDQRQRRAAQDFAIWRECYKALSAVQDWQDWGRNELLELRRRDPERYRSEFVGPLLLFNPYQHFADPKCEAAWQQLMTDIRPTLEAIERKRADMGESEVVTFEAAPQDELARATERMMTAFAEVYGATNPRALGFSDWESLRVKSRRP